jgi:hypothetical protein
MHLSMRTYLLATVSTTLTNPAAGIVCLLATVTAVIAITLGGHVLTNTKETLESLMGKRQ